MKSWIKRCHSSILHEQVVSYSKSSSWSRLRPSVTVPTLAIYPSPHTGAFCPFITLMVAFPWSFPLKAASLQARDYIYYIDLSFSKTTWDLINTLLTSLSYSRKQFNKSSILLISYIDLCFSFTIQFETDSLTCTLNSQGSCFTECFYITFGFLLWFEILFRLKVHRVIIYVLIWGSLVDYHLGHKIKSMNPQGNQS